MNGLLAAALLAVILLLIRIEMNTGRTEDVMRRIESYLYERGKR